MIITINGKKYSDYQEGITVMELIEKLNLHKKQIIVELNQLALIKKDYQSLSLKDGDSIEIVQIAAGG
ncbi:MAG: thiamine biosynthesis protein ThiS [Verrucomicrobiaceae bacterium]|jgi:sulfur carrier protein|nr:thiamine biosynthesis protein ThiS [Verrucomicrobiales bacterium]MAH33847.1 thiamine biosynthesis protein ThiS [Verrucomicrobiales bacterium]MAN81834.1 thiamine biosynthesis protein ThiS [Verrucomicrobiales bacterium]MBB26922.1 thiamine biosynthesis protein ThiS [Verrucomicrobiaceae bacterium]|tara:strand:+ start:61 stop:264 length:204 start_codon:yes stop_codon:yes gene_type:complete